ncbi:hypothetical protein AVEN_186001-1 [Araneus ventricosus]|uniref:Uncharacterized protein n=1 Tax=Araneus ventricosus TaxID=182803 RepID=A0A4Y2R611_ARAVE|nr:hypothetical protein AVEN_186001-1 [Araneus ventricosus]
MQIERVFILNRNDGLLAMTWHERSGHEMRMLERDTSTRPGYEVCAKGYSGINMRGCELLEPFQSSKFKNCVNVPAYQSTQPLPTCYVVV